MRRLQFMLRQNGHRVIPDKAYLCAFQEMCTKHVVGWNMEATIPEGLVSLALQLIFLAQPLAPSLLVYSGRGRTW